MFPKTIRVSKVLAFFLAVRSSTDPMSAVHDSVFSQFVSMQVVQRGNSYPSAAFYVAYEWLLVAQQMASDGLSYRTFP